MGVTGAQPVTDETIALAAAKLRSGELVAMPTETVYGLGADALDPIAVAKVFALKGRPRFDPLIVHVPSIAEVAPLVAGELAPAARLLAERSWPGPLTLVLPKNECVPEIVTAGLPNVAVRVPDHPVTQRLLRAAGRPIAAPSANRFGRISPTTAQHVVESFGDECPLVLDAGPCRVGVESTVVSVTEAGCAILRPGGVSLEAIQSVVGEVDCAWLRAAAEGDNAGQLAPGMLASHYAPSVPLVMHGSALDAGDVEPPTSARWGLLCIAAPAGAGRFACVEELSPSGDLVVAAAMLFAAMRRLERWRDAQGRGLDAILAVAPAPVGLGLAIADRLYRAAAR
jgi:L-threonylcarbamoyladenylate synthase